jgi:iron complex transport system permease protein
LTGDGNDSPALGTGVTATIEAPPQADAPTATRATAAKRGLFRSGWAKGGGLVVLAGVLAFVCFLSLAYGSKPIPLGTVMDALWDFDGSNDHLIVRTLRGPRTIVGLLVGAGLGLAGAVMQGVTRNPLADPGLLGIESGAALAVVLAIHTFDVDSVTGHVWFALVGAGVGSIVVYTIGSMGRGGATPVKLALAGAALAALFTSLVWAILLLDVTTLDQFRFWLVGSIAGRDSEVAWSVAPFLAVGAVLGLGSARSLNTLALGEDVARSLGQRLAVTRTIAVLSVALLCGGATAAAGPIAFVGLTVPHIARAICGPDYRWVLPWSLLLAPTLLIGADVIGRVVARPGELQVGIVTALVGAPFFVALVRRRKLASL